MISMIFLISLDRNALAGRFSRAGPAASLGKVRSAATSLRRYPPPLRRPPRPRRRRRCRPRPRPCPRCRPRPRPRRYSPIAVVRAQSATESRRALTLAPMHRRLTTGRDGVSSMSQGSSRAPVVVRPPSRFPLGPSGIPLICCPSCGKGVEEYKSKKQGGRIFFKCPDNEQYVCNFA